ncbi:MAG: hypothetical protein CUN55_14385 [Phototrophicales bacterium]|nr:MAG: hypothetical protein CUN55_14385 [Phototrophicales bacterium]
MVASELGFSSHVMNYQYFNIDRNIKIIHQLHIARLHLYHLRQLAEEYPTQEICGLIGGTFGNDGIVFASAIYPIQNVAKNPKVAFRLDERQQIKALYEIMSMGLELVGIFHSHPFGPSRPSESDLRLCAYPQVVNCIIFPLQEDDVLLMPNCYQVEKMIIGAWQFVGTAHPVTLVAC